MGILIKAFFAAMLGLILILTVAETLLPSLGELAARHEEKRAPRYENF